MKPSAFVLLCTLAMTCSANAADTLLLTGTELSPSGSYAYLGALTPLGSGSSPGKGWVMRHWLDRLTYDYDGSQPDIHAQGYGYSSALGFQQALKGSRIGIYGAFRIAHTELSPDDPSNVDSGTHGRFSIQADAYTRLGDVAENQLIAQAEIGNGGYYLRDRLLFHISGRYTLGPEIISKGSRVYSAWQAGAAFGGIAFSKRTQLLLRAGIGDQRGQAKTGYVGVELTWDP